MRPGRVLANLQAGHLASRFEMNLSDARGCGDCGDRRLPVHVASCSLATLERLAAEHRALGHARQRCSSGATDYGLIDTETLSDK
jgi:hypothetical protein